MRTTLLILLVGQIPPGPAYLPPTGDAAGEIRQPQPSNTTLNIYLRHYDTDRNGVLSPAEIPENLVNHFAKTDANNDGYLDAREILESRTKIGHFARKAEGVRINLRGELVWRRGMNEPSDASADQSESFDPALTNVGGMEPNTLSSATMNPQTLNTPGLNTPGLRANGFNPQGLSTNGLSQQGLNAAEFGTLTPNSASTPASNPPATMPRPAADPNPRPAPVARQNGPARKKTNNDGYPEPEEIIENLDTNGNGRIDRNEAVDQLSDRFATIDKNADGMLDRQELERALRLAKMFGIKPNVDPQKYRK